MSRPIVPGDGSGVHDPGRETLRPVSAAHPCGVCGGNHKCAVGDHGLLICGRRDGPVPGFRHLGLSKADPQWNLYRVESPDRAAPRRGRGTKSSADGPSRAAAFAANVTPPRLDRLSEVLGLPVPCFAFLPLLGFDPNDRGGRCFLFPERDADGNVVGLNRRYGTGAKKMLPGGKRGLTLVDGWRDRPGPVFVVEGASDALALTAAGLAAVGRPSNTGGADELAALFAAFPTDRPVVVVGENDQKDSGRWPGKEGAERVSGTLTKRLGRTVGWALPPDGAKDVRAWLTARVARTDSAESWLEAGRELSAALCHGAVSMPDAPPSRVEIVASPNEIEVNDQACDALAADPDLYQRGGALVRIVTDSGAPTRGLVRPPGPRIDLLPKGSLRERLTRDIEWLEPKKTKGGEEKLVPTHPPGWCVLAVHERRTWPRVRRLESLVDYPVLRPDGTLLNTPGYDPGTGLYLAFDGDPPPVPADPTRPDALAARDVLLDVVSEFPFEAPVHRAAWLAGLLTPLARFAFAGPSPLFLVDANVRGAGKGLLCDTVARVVTGRPFAVASYTADQDEMRKRITAIAIEGDRLVLLDNLEGKFGNGTIDRALTASTWKDRVLGENRQVEVPLWATWFATGNNVRVQADTARRICHVRLESPLEMPEDRADLRRPDLLEWVGTHRPRLLGAALTILAAYARAGRPRVEAAPWGSFEGWSALVRAAVIWVGLPDPARTRTLLQDAADVEAAAAATLVAGWQILDPERRGLTAGQALSRITNGGQNSGLSELQETLETLLPRMDGRLLGVKLRDLRRRRFGGLYLDVLAKAGGANRWTWFRADGGSEGPTETASCGRSDRGGRGARPPAGHDADDTDQGGGHGGHGARPPAGSESDSRGIWWLDGRGMSHRLAPGSSPNDVPPEATYWCRDGENWKPMTD